MRTRESECSSHRYIIDSALTCRPNTLHNSLKPLQDNRPHIFEAISLPISVHCPQRLHLTPISSSSPRASKLILRYYRLVETIFKESLGTLQLASKSSSLLRVSVCSTWRMTMARASPSRVWMTARKRTSGRPWRMLRKSWRG